MKKGTKIIYKNPNYRDLGFVEIGNKHKQGTIKEDFNDGCLLVIDSLKNEGFINKEDVITKDGLKQFIDLKRSQKNDIL